MASFNQVILIGNLTRDPELRVTPKGTSICQFSIAVNRTYKDDSGNTKEEVNFFDIEAWGKQGETISKYMSKGRPIFVQGRLRQDTWDDKTTGQKRSKIKIVLDGFQFIGSREGGATQSAGASEESFDQASPVERNSPPPRPPAPRNAPPSPPAAAQDNIDEDVPF